MELIVFALFAGFGNILFGEALRLGFDKVLFIFAGIQFITILAAIPLFRNEIPNKQESKMTKSSYNKEQNMETIRYRTNIGCSSCIKAASFFLDDNAQILDWHIDTNHPENILTIRGLQVNKQKIIQELSFAGFDDKIIDGAGNAKGCSI